MPAERAARWVAGFAERHGPVSATIEPYGHCLVAADGSVAQCHVTVPPVSGDRVEDLLAHLTQPRCVAVLLVRLGGYAVGVHDGRDWLATKVGSRPVHGRNAAGGQSQQRFARRREGQVRVAQQAAADTAARVLLPYAARFDAVVTGGERRSVGAVLADRRLSDLPDRVVPRFLTVPDPRRAVLDMVPTLMRNLHIRVVESESSPFDRRGTER